MLSSRANKQGECMHRWFCTGSGDVCAMGRGRHRGAHGGLPMLRGRVYCCHQLAARQARHLPDRVQNDSALCIIRDMPGWSRGNNFSESDTLSAYWF